MDITATLWGLNSGLIIVLGFFMKKWINDLEKKIDGSSLQSFNVFQIFFVEINQISFFVSVVS